MIRATGTIEGMSYPQKLEDENKQLRQQVARLQDVKIEYEVRMKEMRKDAYDEAEALRQQVTELEGKLEAVSTESYLTNDDLHKEQALSSTLQNECDRQKYQLALRDLEIVKLREALEEIERWSNNVVGESCNKAIDKICEQALSTTFTPDHLNEWIKQQIGK